jgi:integrase
MKNRKSLTVNIEKPTDVAALRAFLLGKPLGAPLFPLPEQHAAKMLKRDLEVAGIEYQTAAGCADFHSLRHSFATQGAEAGVHPKTLQKLLGHSNINLTMKFYTHLKAEDESAAAKALPDLVQPNDGKAAPRVLPMESA